MGWPTHLYHHHPPTRQLLLSWKVRGRSEGPNSLECPTIKPQIFMGQIFQLVEYLWKKMSKTIHVFYIICWKSEHACLEWKIKEIIVLRWDFNELGVHYTHSDQNNWIWNQNQRDFREIAILNFYYVQFWPLFMGFGSFFQF